MGDVSYYVRLPRTQKEYLDGDRVRARITKRADGSQLSEVQILSLEQRTQKTLLARIIPKNGKRYISVLSEFGYYETHLIQIPTDIEEDDVLHVRFALTGKLTIVGKFAKSSNFDYQEKLLFFLSGTRMDFSPQIEHEAERMQ